MLDARVSVSAATNALSQNVVRLRRLTNAESKRLFQYIMIEAISHIPLIEGTYDSVSEQQELEDFIDLVILQPGDEFQGPPQEDPGRTILGVLNATIQAVGVGGGQRRRCVLYYLTL